MISYQTVMHGYNDLLAWGDSYTYHWFFGLKKIKRNVVTTTPISQLLSHYQRNNNLSQLKLDVEAYRKRNALVRFFIRLFNYNDLSAY